MKKKIFKSKDEIKSKSKENKQNKVKSKNKEDKKNKINKNIIISLIGVVLMIIAMIIIIPIINSGLTRRFGILLFVFAVIFIMPIIFNSIFKKIIAKIKKRKFGRFLIRITALIIIISVLTYGVISCMMIGAMNTPAAENATVVVLGCQVHSYGPSLMLRGRLNAAVQYLRDNPQSVCIVSGAQGTNEPTTEALAMKNELLKAGIDSDRIILEEKATSTYENIFYSKEIIDSRKLNSEVVIVTDEFHQFRAQLFAKRLGIKTGAQYSNTPDFLFAMYWSREVAANIRAIIFGV